MTMTETRPSDAPKHEPDDHGDDATSQSQPGLIAVFGSGDPAVIGRLWIGTSLLFLLGGLVLSVVIGAESLKTLTFDVFSQDTYFQAFSLQHVGLVFLAAMPLLVGVGTVVVPRQIGAHTIAFPRAAAGAYWAYLLGAAMTVAAYLVNGGPYGGSVEGVDLFLLSLGLVSLAIILASICIATTVLALRPAGMSLDRVPAFAWSMLVATVAWTAGLAVLVGVLALLFVDHHYRAFNLSNGSSADFARNIESWISFMRTQPQIYALGIPALGFASDVVTTLTGRPQKRHGILIASIALFGVLSFGAWTVAGITNGHIYREALFTGMSVAVLLPFLAVLGGVAESIVKGTLTVRAPLLYALGAMLVLGGALVVGALQVVAPFHLLGTTAHDAVTFGLVTAAVITGIGAAHWWWPQIVGQHLTQPLAIVTAGLLFLGGIVWIVPLAIAGFLDQPFGFISAAAMRDGVEVLNGVAMVGAGVVALAVVFFLINLAASLARSADDAETLVDPWDGFTLEWAADPRAVAVTSATPLLDQKEAAAS
jgi:heme/copper-type cytochrome/quinol oxidase subunit 1